MTRRLDSRKAISGGRLLLPNLCDPSMQNKVENKNRDLTPGFY